jgi:hypothetical protein
MKRRRAWSSAAEHPFDRHLSLTYQVHGAEDRSHAALTERLFDPVLAGDDLTHPR